MRFTGSSDYQLYASVAPEVKFRILIDLALPSSTMYLCTGMNTIYTLNNTYSPAGPLGGIDPVQESVDAFPKAIRMWLTATNTQYLADAVTENMFAKPVVLRRCFLSESYFPVSTPEIMWNGRVSRVDVHFGDISRGNYIEMEVESRLRREPRAARFNRESLHNAVVTSTNGFQTAGVYSGDTFFNYVNLIPGFTSGWGWKADGGPNVAYVVNQLAGPYGNFGG